MFKAANPYDDTVTKATAETLTSENWEANLEVCDKVSNEGETGARNCVAAIQKRLVHRNANVQLYALTLADALAKNCGIAAHRELASRNFTQAVARVVADRNTHASVRDRALSILEEWAKDFNDADGTLGLVKETVDQLAQQGFRTHANQAVEEPQEPSSEQLRREDEELRRVLELSVQDQGGRASYGQASGNGTAPSGTFAPSGSSAAAAAPIYPANGASGPGAATAALLDKSLPDPNRTEPQSSQHTQPQPQHQPPPPSQALKAPSRVRALYDFAPSEAGELPFSKGDVIRVLDSVYEHWWRGEVRGEAGIFPVNYVEVLPDPTPEEIRREAEQEARIFQQAADIDRLLSRLRILETEAAEGRGDAGSGNLAEDEELQDLYQSSLAMRPRIVRLIDRYSSKVSELRALNDKFVHARSVFDTMMEKSMAVHQPGQSSRPYLGARPEYGYQHGSVSPAPSAQQHGAAQLGHQQQHHQGAVPQVEPTWGAVNGYPSATTQPHQHPTQQQPASSEHDPHAYAQWQHQQQHQSQHQYHPGVHDAASSAAAYPGSANAGQYQPAGHQQYHAQTPSQPPPQSNQAGYPANPYGASSQPSNGPSGYAGSSSAPSAGQAAPSDPAAQNTAEDEKRRLYEQARREAEAYHAAHGQQAYAPTQQ